MYKITTQLADQLLGFIKILQVVQEIFCKQNMMELTVVINVKLKNTSAKFN